jgi:hypothetical protein
LKCVSHSGCRGHDSSAALRRSEAKRAIGVGRAARRVLDGDGATLVEVARTNLRQLAIE